VVGLVIVATAALIAAIVTFGVFLPALSSLGSGGAGTAQAVQGLPAQISVCGLDWDRGDKVLSEAEVFARDERDPITVSTGPFAACPDAVVASATSPEGPVTTVYVTVADGQYVAYTRDLTP
jgi:hypothetical protein